MLDRGKASGSQSFNEYIFKFKGNTNAGDAKSIKLRIGFYLEIISLRTEVKLDSVS